MSHRRIPPGLEVMAMAVETDEKDVLLPGVGMLETWASDQGMVD